MGTFALKLFEVLPSRCHKTHDLNCINAIRLAVYEVWICLLYLKTYVVDKNMIAGTDWTMGKHRKISSSNQNPLFISRWSDHFDLTLERVRIWCLKYKVMYLTTILQNRWTYSWLFLYPWSKTTFLTSYQIIILYEPGLFAYVF